MMTTLSDAHREQIRDEYYRSSAVHEARNARCPVCRESLTICAVDSFQRPCVNVRCLTCGYEVDLMRQDDPKRSTFRDEFTEDEGQALAKSFRLGQSTFCPVDGSAIEVMDISLGNQRRYHLACDRCGGTWRVPPG